MTDLSPAAQAVLDAVVDGALPPFHVIARPMAAAALEAVADQVVPKEWPTIEDYNEYDQGVATAHIKCRNELLAIAAELRGDNPTNEEKP